MLQQFLDWLYGHEREIMAIVAGLLAAWGVTQRVKFLVPSHWSYHAREVATQGLAFIIGSMSTFLIWNSAVAVSEDPCGQASTQLAINAAIAGLIVGLASPAIWNIFTLVVGFKWPWMKDALSQDVRKGVRLSEISHD